MTEPSDTPSATGMRVTERSGTRADQESLELRREQEADDKANRTAARQRGGKPLPAGDFKRLAFDVHQAPDNDYLDEILAGADSATVVFNSKRMDARGGTAYLDRVLQIKLRDRNVLDVGRSIGRSWTARWRAGKTPSQHEAVSEVSGLLVERDLLDEGEDARYGSAAITVRGNLYGRPFWVANR